MIRFGLAALFSGLMLAAACDAAPSDEASSRPKVVPVRSRCADHLIFQVDRASFVASPGGRYAPARLNDLARRARPAFTAAADEMCVDGRLDPTVFEGVMNVRVETGSGATETAVYDDPEIGPETLFFQYVFAETDLALPAEADIQAGILCWKDAGRPECEGRGD